MASAKIEFQNKKKNFLLIFDFYENLEIEFPKLGIYEKLNVEIRRNLLIRFFVQLAIFCLHNFFISSWKCTHSYEPTNRPTRGESLKFQSLFLTLDYHIAPENLRMSKMLVAFPRDDKSRWIQLIMNNVRKFCQIVRVTIDTDCYIF